MTYRRVRFDRPKSGRDDALWVAPPELRPMYTFGSSMTHGVDHVRPLSMLHTLKKIVLKYRPGMAYGSELYR